MSRPAGSAARRAAAFTITMEQRQPRRGEPNTWLQILPEILPWGGRSVIKPSQSRAIPARERVLAGRVFRDGKSGQLPGFGAERRFSAAELFSAVTVVMAGGGGRTGVFVSLL